jgi:hypothetical protein
MDELPRSADPPGDVGLTDEIAPFHANDLHARVRGVDFADRA